MVVQWLRMRVSSRIKAVRDHVFSYLEPLPVAL